VRKVGNLQKQIPDRARSSNGRFAASYFSLWTLSTGELTAL
jgi:hypothetical protein